MNIENQGKIVIIDSVKLTQYIRLERFAALNDDVDLIDGELPPDGCGIYYRVILSGQESEVIISDNSGLGLNSLEETVKFFAKWSKK